MATHHARSASHHELGPCSNCALSIDTRPACYNGPVSNCICRCGIATVGAIGGDVSAP
ncbi:hypothetical protein FHR75_004477 [Kineococcus radiotolerans]|uniref:Uncharacterized protein n=1 Tax=Kineococcus radiotolerans TaxID=131568 RepID=A0A7W4XZU7_KINRA|nr:hypothetical protein [Kineococcus radiotolerans]MBB2903634.1 hypothetical protein [Kineococcus radiotolerans]